MRRQVTLLPLKQGRQWLLCALPQGAGVPQ